VSKFDILDLKYNKEEMFKMAKKAAAKKAKKK
jgi:hypothetical protein